MNIAVIGAGVFGAWTAWHLAEDGHRVTLIDAFGPANGRASSADHSRVIRCGYGADTIYSRWAREALRDWNLLSVAAGQTLLIPTGALFLGEPGNAYIRASYDALSGLGVRAEWVEAGAIAERFPQISPDGLGPALFEPDAGVLRARDAVRALVQVLAARARAKFRVARVAPLDESRSAADVRLLDGATLAADGFVLACGPWLPQLLPESVGERVRPTRQEVLYYGVPAGDTRFSTPLMPVWIDFGAGVYGVPDIDSMGFKIGIDRHGAPIEPDDADRVVDQHLIETTRAWMARRFPGLAGAPLVDSHVCQYENTASGDFVIDRHPVWSNVWIVGGGSGHGFKHGPAVGRYVADLVAGRGKAEPRFALATKTTLAERAVY
jgi:monomeric sarcosine oxidase